MQLVHVNNVIAYWRLSSGLKRHLIENTDEKKRIVSRNNGAVWAR